MALGACVLSAPAFGLAVPACVLAARLSAPVVRLCVPVGLASVRAGPLGDRPRAEAAGPLVAVAAAVDAAADVAKLEH